MSKLNVTVCGCGNGSHACAALLSKKGHNVNIYSPITKEIELFKQNYENSNGLTLKMGSGIMEGLSKDNNEYANANNDIQVYDNLKLNIITDKAEEVIPHSSLIIVITPSFAHRNIINNIKELVTQDSVVIFLPSRSGIEYEVNNLMPGINVIAFQTLPWACRIKTFGSEIYISGVKNKIQAASMPPSMNDIFFNELEALLEMRIERLKHVTTLSLANVGQIFHPGIMYGLFKNNPYATFYEDNLPLFYQGITEETAEMLSNMSLEIKKVADELSKVNPLVESEKVLHIKDWLMDSYDGIIGDCSSVYSMITTNEAYKGIKAPVKKVGEYVYAPDFGCRYIVEDIPYGLLITKSMASMMNVNTPVIDEVISSLGKWTGYDYLGKLNDVMEFSSKSRIPQLYGTQNINDYNKY